jgi:hypothetical protein
MTICPNVVKYVPVSTTTSPVTHVAEVAVKSASINGSGSPLADAIGSDNNTAPSKMINAKPETRIRGGFKNFAIPFNACSASRRNLFLVLIL